MSLISLQALDLHFDYDSKTQVFEGHNLIQEVDLDQPNKLYGIIGPSGGGKTTLLSILGGQLKPANGQVLVNGTDIYAVDDLVRRQLIALQIQTSTSIRGKVKHNLLFGIPIDDESGDLVTLEDGVVLNSDEFLIQVLQNVGLWSIFKTKDGLDTMIGEGGLNLSGGQRQRLNFAGLYLRSLYFKPKLILIDEPTSSLDEISEMAITKMIDELASKALTLVVAHRLKTLETSKGILDISLVQNQKDMIFMDKIDLLKESKYYQDLMAGKIELDG